jgi:hypothetical protein
MSFPSMLIANMEDPVTAISAWGSCLCIQCSRWSIHSWPSAHNMSSGFIGSIVLPQNTTGVSPPN